MRVLMFGWEFPPNNSGGLGVACQGLARALSSKVGLTFVLPKRMPLNESGFKIRFANLKNMSQVEIDSLLVPYITSKGYREALLSGLDELGNYGRSLFEEVERYAFLARGIARSEQFDVIHAHDWLSFRAAIETHNVSGKPFVAHIHATEVDRTGGRWSVNQEIYDREREGIHKADKVLTVSNFTKRVLVEHYDVPEGKIEVVHNGIDPSGYFLQEAPDDGLSRLKGLGYKIVLYYGRITLMKGVDYLISAAPIVLRERPRTLFVIVGAGDMEGQIMEQVASLGLSNNVLFPGFLRGRELSRVIRAADVFVTPSISEPFGLTPLESLLHGTPVIISKQSGVSEVLKNVMRVDFWDIEEMADKILSVLEYGSLKSELVNNGSREAFMNNWEKAASKCLNIYNMLLS